MMNFHNFNQLREAREGLATRAVCSGNKSLSFFECPLLRGGARHAGIGAFSRSDCCTVVTASCARFRSADDASEEGLGRPSAGLTLAGVVCSKHAVEPSRDGGGH